VGVMSNAEQGIRDARRRQRMGRRRSPKTSCPQASSRFRSDRKAQLRRAAMKTITTHYIDGAFVESHGREVMDIIRPIDGQVIGRVTLADEEDTRRAIAVA